MQKKNFYICTTRDRFDANDIDAAFRENTTGYKVRHWTRKFIDAMAPDTGPKETSVRHYWEFKAMVTKEQEIAIRKVVNAVNKPARGMVLEL